MALGFPSCVRWDLGPLNAFVIQTVCCTSLKGREWARLTESLLKVQEHEDELWQLDSSLSQLWMC